MLKALERKNGIAKRLQLRDILIELIGNEYAPGQRFYSERELMNMFGVSSLTVSRAMKSLADEGVVERKVGGGTFVLKGGEEALFLLNKGTFSVLYVNISPRLNLAEADPLNWFITGEIQRGIINSFPGKIRMLETSDILAQFKNAPGTGCILLNSRPEEEAKMNRLTRNLVCIDLDSYLKPASNCIRWECASGVYDLISYLALDCGHRKIALIAGSSAPHINRIGAFRIACEAFGVQCPPECVRMVDSGTRESGAAALRELLRLGKKRPTAVFVDTDIKAEGALLAAREAGVKVPEELSITGFDDIPDAKFMNPPLTTVKVPYYEMGVQAVKKLLSGVRKETACVPMKTELVVRKSTGPVPK